MRRAAEASGGGEEPSGVTVDRCIDLSVSFVVGGGFAGLDSSPERAQEAAAARYGDLEAVTVEDQAKGSMSVEFTADGTTEVAYKITPGPELCGTELRGASTQ